MATMSATWLCSLVTVIISIEIHNVVSSLVNCVGDRECKDTTKDECAANEDCVIDCTGFRTCMGTTLICPTGHACNVTCSGDEACWGAVIEAAFSTELYLNGCNGGSSLLYVCQNIDVYCPLHEFGEPKCHISGDENGLSSCYCGGDRVGKNQLNFYAINGFLDMDFSGYTGSSYPGTMHCLSGYTESCSIGTGWSCADNTICDITLSPTDTPTTSDPTTAMPTTVIPTTNQPTTAIPTTSMPTTTAIPTTSNPTTAIPTTAIPITSDVSTTTTESGDEAIAETTTLTTDSMDANYNKETAEVFKMPSWMIVSMGLFIIIICIIGCIVIIQCKKRKQIRKNKIANIPLTNIPNVTENVEEFGRIQSVSVESPISKGIRNKHENVQEFIQNAASDEAVIDQDDIITTSPFSPNEDEFIVENGDENDIITPTLGENNCIIDNPNDNEIIIHGDDGILQNIQTRK